VREQTYYVKNGQPTSERSTIRQALRFLRRLYGSTAAKDFSPKGLKAVRQAMVEHLVTRTLKVRDEATGQVTEQIKVIHHGLARKYINKQIGRIRRMFGWAVEEELVPVTVHQALLRVKSLRKGKSNAREKPRVKPVPDAHVEAVLPLVPATVRAMIEIQRLSGGRPQDILQMRAVDIDMAVSPWEYHPELSSYNRTLRAHTATWARCWSNLAGPRKGKLPAARPSVWRPDTSWDTQVLVSLSLLRADLKKQRLRTERPSTSSLTPRRHTAIWVAS
jgi:hypothetical protein